MNSNNPLSPQVSIFAAPGSQVVGQAQVAFSAHTTLGTHDLCVDGTLLSTFIPSLSLRGVVIDLLARCEKPHDIIDTVVPVLRGACGLLAEVVRGRRFCNAMLPFLTGLEKPSLENVLQAMKAVK